MNKNKVKKVNHLNKISELKNSYNSVIMVSHHKLPTEQLAQFRDSMFENDCKIIFIKNKIANLSFKNDSFESSLENSNFLIFGNDIFSLIKESNKFIKSLKLYPDAKLSIMAGFLDNDFVNNEELKSLEKIPSKEHVYVGILNAVLYPIRTIVRILDIHTKKEAENNS